MIRKSLGGFGQGVFALFKLLLLSTSFSFAGCAVVKVQVENSNQVKTHWMPGIVFINIDRPKEYLSVVEGMGAGVIVTPNGFTVGLWQETIAVASQTGRCSLILWVESNVELRALESVLRASGVAIEPECVIRKKS